jgi:hypothetical protein
MEPQVSLTLFGFLVGAFGTMIGACRRFIHRIIPPWWADLEHLLITTLGMHP